MKKDEDTVKHVGGRMGSNKPGIPLYGKSRTAPDNGKCAQPETNYDSSSIDVTMNGNGKQLLLLLQRESPSNDQAERLRERGLYYWSGIPAPYRLLQRNLNSQF